MGAITRDEATVLAARTLSRSAMCMIAASLCLTDEAVPWELRIQYAKAELAGAMEEVRALTHHFGTLEDTVNQ